MSEERTPLSEEDRELARVLGRRIWLTLFRDANPNASKEQVEQEWEANRKRYISAGRRVASQMKKQGYSITKA